MEKASPLDAKNFRTFERKILGKWKASLVLENLKAGADPEGVQPQMCEVGIAENAVYMPYFAIHIFKIFLYGTAPHTL